MNKIMAGGLDGASAGAGGGEAVAGGLAGVVSGVGSGSAAVGRMVFVGSGRLVGISVGAAGWTAAGWAHADSKSRTRRVRIK